jgi:hypothetical protein
MKHALSMLALSVALAATCGSAGLARAADEAAGGPAFAFGPGAQVVDMAVLAEQRGGADVHEMTLSKIWANGSVSDVEAYDLTTGSNVISGGAFANASGSMMNVQNSGNGVLIQNATIFNVEVH